MFTMQRPLLLRNATEHSYQNMAAPTVTTVTACEFIKSSGLPSVEEASVLTETITLHLCKGNILVWSANGMT